MSRAPEKSRSTLTDVAKMAGVSESTVSLVLAGKGLRRRISADTHDRVRIAAHDLGYTPSLLHRSMQRGRTQVLSLYNAFRNRDRDDLYMNRLTAAITHAGGVLGYDILVHSNFQRDTRETYEFLNGGLSDGLVLFGPSADEPLLPLLRNSRLPTVIIGPRRDESALSTVLDDEALGMKLIAEALVSNGHRRIAAIVESLGRVLDPTGRLDRLRHELAIHGVVLDESDVIVWKGSAEDAVQQLRALPSKPTAFFVWHDRVAYRIVEACEKLGVRVPEELSVVGYDGLVWPSTSGHIVTSVQVPLHEMAEVGVALLHRLIEGDRGPLTKTLPVHFLTGTTLGPSNRIDSNGGTHK